MIDKRERIRKYAGLLAKLIPFLTVGIYGSKVIIPLAIFTRTLTIIICVVAEMICVVLFAVLTLKNTVPSKQA